MPRTRRFSMRIAPAAALATALSLACAAPGELLKRYEYDEEVYLALDGAATVYVNASVAALVALRGFDLDLNPRARLDRAKIHALYTAPGVTVTRVTSSRRDGRRFVHVRLEVDDIRRLPATAPFAWGRYALDRRGDLYSYRHTVGRSAGRDVGDVGWRGTELVAFRVHLPSKVPYHNAGPGNLKRGNILVWEQSLADRRAGAPLAMEARLEAESILYRTLWLFGATIAAVAAMFAGIIALIIRKGRAAAGDMQHA